MKVESYPLILAAVLALIGIALIYDARAPDYTVLPRERRRRARIERDRRGEMLVGLGILALAAAIAGRDIWRYRILAMLLGGALILYGSIRNRHFFGSLLSDRGALRRRERPTDSLGGKGRRPGTGATAIPVESAGKGPGPGEGEPAEPHEPTVPHEPTEPRESAEPGEPRTPPRGPSARPGAGDPPPPAAS
jgi:hypothetical protein